MSGKIKEIVDWLLVQGAEATRTVLEEKLNEAYNAGRCDAYDEALEVATNDIKNNIMLNIKREKNVLYENNFYQTPSEEATIQMRAYEYLEEKLPEIIKQYKRN